MGLKNVLPIKRGNLEFSLIQGGMGAGVSNWRLARAVSELEQLGVVSGTALDFILARRLQDGDLEGHMRHALEHFPFQNMVQHILNKYFIPGGRKPDEPYPIIGMHTLEGNRELHELCIAGNFVEVFLAKEGHQNPVGINYLEKIQLPHLPSLYGAMLAGVDVVIMGAGIPMEIPGVLDALAQHSPARYPIHVTGASPGQYYSTFDPSMFQEDFMNSLKRPAFFPIIGSSTLGQILCRRANGKINGFVVEGPKSGGHNTPPRGLLNLTDDGQPIYGPRDVVDMEAMRNLGLPFWLAGTYGSREKLYEAFDMGAMGVQVGTAFALCVESGIEPEIRRELVRKALEKNTKVFTDPRASPTGFPFKVAQLEGSLSEKEDYMGRKRTCDLRFLPEIYLRENGSIGYRCPAEPEKAYLAKGGKLEDTVGRKCLCNGLIANVGMPQLLSDGTYEKCLITLGDDFSNIGSFCKGNNLDYTAEDVVREIFG